MERLQKLSESRLENIKAMSSYLDDVAEALGVAKPGTPVEGIGACWKVMGAIETLQAKNKKFRGVMEDCVAGHDDCCNYVCNKIKETLAESV